MAICPFAYWMPVKTKQEQRRQGAEPLGLILHISNSRRNTLAGLLATFSPGGSNPFPSHFGVQTDGKLGQFIDTKYHDWAEEWSTKYISIECAASPGDSLTVQQLYTVATLYAWLYEEHSVTFDLANKPGDAGLGYHSMGKTGHTSCPGPNVIAQRPSILSIAQVMAFSQTTPSYW